jgi:hypothetical protein
MPATALSVPESTPETVDFLRRLSSMMTGGRNAEMLQEAAAAIETLSQRATMAESQLQQLQEDHGKNLEQREIAELASDNLLVEVTALKEHLAHSQSQAETELAALKTRLADNDQRSEAEIGSLRLHLVENLREAEAQIASLKAQLTASNAHAESEIASLKAQIEQRDRLAEIDRRVFAEETERLRALASRSEAAEDTAGIDESVAVVSVQALQLARTQFGYLAKTFEKSGDVTFLTMCAIGAQALDKALADTRE